MAFRGGLGPVFAFEWLTATRRWQMYAWRIAFVSMLLLGLVFVWGSHIRRPGLDSIKDQAAIGREFFQTLLAIELFMVLLAAPAATAGAICQDKARGSLFHVLVTDLSDAEIVLGKLAARLIPVLGLIAASLPVMALATLLGGIDPVALTGATLVLLAMAVLGCSLALTLSVWGKKTHEVLLAMYAVWILWILILPMAYALPRGGVPGWLARSNPFLSTVAAHDPAWPSSPWFIDQALFAAGSCAVSALLLAWTVVRLRPVIIGQWGRAASAPRPLWRRLNFGPRTMAPRKRERGRPWRLPGPTLDGNPVLWYEWHKRRPTRWARAVWGLYFILGVGFGAVALACYLGSSGYDEFPVLVNVLLVGIGLLLLSVTSATSLAEERMRGSLDVLLATPLPTPAIVWGKWWGAYRTVLPLAILPTLIAFALAPGTGRWAGPPLVLGLTLAYGAALTSLGLALSTWIPQHGRVLGLSVAAFVGVSIGWVAIVILLFPDGPQSLALYAVMASPLYGIGFLSVAIEETRGPAELWPGCAIAAIFWVVEYLTVAGLLLAATLLTFDHCLGRISDGLALPGLAPAAGPPKRKPTPELVEEIV